MQLIYVHGLDSGPESIKGEMLEDYCREHHPSITVQRPDLNCEPAVSYTHLTLPTNREV